MWKHIFVGYEDCPVATDDLIYGIAKVDSKWVVVFRDEVIEWKAHKKSVIYHEIDKNIMKYLKIVRYGRNN